MPTTEIVILGERATCPYCGHTTGIDFDGESFPGSEGGTRIVAHNTATDPCEHFDGVDGDYNHFKRTGGMRMLAIFNKEAP
jgi:hypothetical protein